MAETTNSQISATLFAASLDALLATLPAPVTRLAVAVSGGPDSMALALLAADYANARNIDLLGLIVDHRLRPESGEEAIRVSGWLAQHSISHQLRVWEHPESFRGNLHDVARQARYQLLTETCRAEGIPALLLGHHQDDQAETLLHHLARGSGVDGLSAMPATRQENDVWLVRPLLSTSKAALIDYCEAQKQAFVNDPSNENPRFARSMLRAMLAQFAPQGLSASRLAETARHMARTQDTLNHYTAEAEAACVKHGTMGCSRVDLAHWELLPEEIRLRVLRGVLQAWNPDAKPRFASLQDLQARLLNEPSGRHTLGPLLWQWRAKQLQCHLVFRHVPGLATNAADTLPAWTDLGWQITLPNACDGLTLAPLGEAGWEFLCSKDRPNIRIARRLAPPAAWQTMPVFWESAYGYLAKPALLPHIYPAGEPLPIEPPSMGACSRFTAHWQPPG